MLSELCRAELANQRQTSQWPGLADLSLSLYQRAVTEAVLSSGALADTPADRYIDGRLDDFLWDVLVQERVLYLSFPVTVPAGYCFEQVRLSVTGGSLSAAGLHTQELVTDCDKGAVFYSGSLDKDAQVEQKKVILPAKTGKLY